MKITCILGGEYAGLHTPGQPRGHCGISRPERKRKTRDKSRPGGEVRELPRLGRDAPDILCDVVRSRPNGKPSLSPLFRHSTPAGRKRLLVQRNNHNHRFLCLVLYEAHRFNLPANLRIRHFGHCMSPRRTAVMQEKPKAGCTLRSFAGSAFAAIKHFTSSMVRNSQGLSGA